MAASKKLRVKPTIQDATIPARPSDGAAWLDLFAAVDACPWPGETLLIDTGIAMALPAGTIAMVCSHTGRASKHGLGVAGGVVIISNDYHGTVKIPISNAGARNQWIRKGQRIARMVVLPEIPVNVDVVQELKTQEAEADPEDDIIARAEEDIRNYDALRVAAMYGDTKAGATVERIDQALAVIADDTYCDIIRMYYIDGRTREEIAEEFETSVTTVSRNKGRLISKISRIICPT